MLIPQEKKMPCFDLNIRFYIKWQTGRYELCDL